VARDITKAARGAGDLGRRGRALTLRFIGACESLEKRATVRTYAFDNADAIALALGVSPATFREALMLVDDADELIAHLRTAIERHRTKSRARRNAEMISRAQSSATILAGVSHWEMDRVHFDLMSVLGSCVTNPRDLLVFAGEEFEVAIPMRILIGLDRLGRLDLRGFVSPLGFHVRWGERGSLNFASKLDPWAVRIVFALPARMSSAAA
jgi:hypothetical protein